MTHAWQENPTFTTKHGYEVVNVGKPTFTLALGIFLVNDGAIHVCQENPTFTTNL